MAAIRRRNLAQPDEQRGSPLSTLAVIRMGTYTVGRGVLQPGFRWSTHMGPIMGVTSCPIHHFQVVISGRFGVRMDDGEEIALEPDDFFEVPPGHDAWVIGDEPVVLLDLGGNIDALAVPSEHERVLATLLMTDIVDSTRMAAGIGDSAWKQVLADHNRIVRQEVARRGGREVNTTGDGFLITFASAVAAIRAARGIRDAVGETGVMIRAGIHTGEVEQTAGDIGGIAVHAVARIMGLAGPGEIFVSSMAAGLSEGSGLSFEERGSHEVKGIARPIHVLRLTD